MLLINRHGPSTLAAYFSRISRREMEEYVQNSSNISALETEVIQDIMDHALLTLVIHSVYDSLETLVLRAVESSSNPIIRQSGIHVVYSPLIETFSRGKERLMGVEGVQHLIEKVEREFLRTLFANHPDLLRHQDDTVF